MPTTNLPDAVRGLGDFPGEAIWHPGPVVAAGPSDEGAVACGPSQRALVLKTISRSESLLAVHSFACETVACAGKTPKYGNTTRAATTSINLMTSYCPLYCLPFVQPPIQNHAFPIGHRARDACNTGCRATAVPPTFLPLQSGSSCNRQIMLSVLCPMAHLPGPWAAPPQGPQGRGHSRCPNDRPRNAAGAAAQAAAAH